MNSINPQISDEIAGYMKKEILPAVPLQIDQFSSQNIEILINKLNILRYFCLQKNVDSNIIQKIEDILESSQVFWDILENNANAISDLKDTYKVRKLDLESTLVSQFEELISGEDTLRDVIINAIATTLGWKSDTIWVDMAKKEHINLSKSYIMSLKDELWKFIAESSQNGNEMTIKKASEIGEKMELLMNFISGENVPALMRIMFISQIYSLLLRFRIIKLFINFTSEPDKT